MGVDPDLLLSVQQAISGAQEVRTVRSQPSGYFEPRSSLGARPRGNGEVARSMQLVAGCTGQAYNMRKGRRGAFWEDFYQSTVVDTKDHLAGCFTYIDLNMVRAGVVDHPREWRELGYQEIQNPRGA